MIPPAKKRLRNGEGDSYDKMSVCGTWRSRRCHAALSDRTGAGGRVQRILPVKTLLINILGAFVIGVLAVLGEKHSLPPLLVLTLKTGVCGGFTTFSTFALETSQLFQNGSYGLGIGYVCASVVLSIAAVQLACMWLS